jgi:hypothetical protein
VSVFHFELRAGVHVAHAFNRSQAELDRILLDAWRRGEDVVFGDRRWPPASTRLKIYEGRSLTGPELSFGRGWTNAVKRADDVTDRLLAQPVPAARPAGAPALDPLRREILAQCRAARTPIHDVRATVDGWYPERRASDRLALAEEAVWGLLHEEQITLLRVADDEPVDQADWEAVLLDWQTWAPVDPAAPAVVIEVSVRKEVDTRNQLVSRRPAPVLSGSLYRAIS